MVAGTWSQAELMWYTVADKAQTRIPEGRATLQGVVEVGSLYVATGSSGLPRWL